MVRFEEITQKNVRVNYVKDDMEGYKVVGSANYDKENRLTDANGSIRGMENEYIADFNVYGQGENARINLTNCIPAKMGEAIEVAQATLADLASTYPQE